MVGHRDVLLDFEELGAVYKGDGVFLSVDRLLEKRGVEFAEVDGGRVGAEGLEEGEVSRYRLDADFHTDEVGGALHRSGVRGDFTESVLREAEETDALRQYFVVEDFAELAVESLIGGFSRIEEVRKVDDLEFRRYVGRDSGREHRHFYRAELHSFEHLALSAELRVRVDVDGDASAGSLFDIFFKSIIEGDDVRFFVRSAVSEFNTELFLCGSGADCHDHNAKSE